MKRMIWVAMVSLFGGTWACIDLPSPSVVQCESRSQCAANKNGRLACIDKSCAPSYKAPQCERGQCAHVCEGLSCDQAPTQNEICALDLDCSENLSGKVFCWGGVCDAKRPFEDCTLHADCLGHPEKKYFCNEGTCEDRPPEQRQCSDDQGCIANTNNTICQNARCVQTYENTKICTPGGSQCEGNRNGKSACIDTQCDFPFVAVGACSGDEDCVFNTNGNTRCLDNLCQPGANPQVRIIWGEDPAHEATISVTASGAKLYMDRRKGRSVLTRYANVYSPSEEGAYTADANTHFANFTLTRLKPSTKYYFSVESEAGISREFYFISAPADDRDFKLLYGGDSRSSSTKRRLVNLLIKKTVEEDPSILAFVHGGDYNSRANDWRQWSSWLDDHSLTTTDDGRVLPLIPTRGNHEGDAETYNEVFASPGFSGTDYWATKIGKLLWITLDTNVSTAGDQRVFLEDALQRGQNFRWIVASYHFPAYPAVKSPGNAKVNWVPLFEQYNVDFVTESDGHVLKRTLPIRDDTFTEGGIVYVGEGGLGVPQRTPKTARWYLAAPGMAMKGHHIQRLSFSKNEARYEAITLLSGGVVDSYSFFPRSR